MHPTVNTYLVIGKTTIIIMARLVQFYVTESISSVMLTYSEGFKSPVSEQCSPEWLILKGKHWQESKKRMIPWYLLSHKLKVPNNDKDILCVKTSIRTKSIITFQWWVMWWRRKEIHMFFNIAHNYHKKLITNSLKINIKKMASLEIKY